MHGAERGRRKVTRNTALYYKKRRYVISHGMVLLTHLLQKEEKI